MNTLLITGASGGLGQDVVTHLHEQGYHILATVGSGRHVNLFDTLPNVETKEVNVVDETSVNTFLNEHESDSIQAAILLVGGFAMGTIQETDTALLQSMFDVNFLSVFNLVKPLMAKFEKQGKGQFVFIGARPALHANEGKNVVAYALSKTLVFELADIINAQGKSKNITATVIVPSTIDTPTNRTAMPDADPSRWVPASNIAELIGFLLNDTGQMMRETVIKLYNRA
ncbi:SDR family NAD(P)-dependent oxidoreductase [Spirosoma sp. BT702]|uniref:SDR family NAD(P)-dependent oxidoreductase n=1 Tax=Spirosoma profusum TaxID=2771354 RepID=A0A926XTW2_9BACT|nr:SDR family NAD(P)-dependent oxidoreductase [Spirosoma profusum]MBD2699804.1 SDR family NAD(P)-dependent oxidoreductase [Spirosoma profusum]